MIFKCPGQDDRNLKAEIVRCPDCGYEVEIFSDELKIKCPRCKGLICRILLPSCIDWCKYARECLGEVKWKMMK
jgi:predicted Zn-ribbon and HTH transcriptional regulator